MGGHRIKVVLLDEALAFVRSLPVKVQEKIVYNYKKRTDEQGTFQEVG